VSTSSNVKKKRTEFGAKLWTKAGNASIEKHEKI